ncbi:hypothetical protein [Mesorhizobium caraganae]|uniref:hypothetical protein n=1 Tax=Mesorhizobium caraganae TaxID=483206 RepID=UPI003ECC90DE
MSDFDDLATVCEMIEQCGRCPIEEAAAPAGADERRAMATADATSRTGPPISTPWDKRYQGHLNRRAAAKKEMM